ncbi:MAG: endonuclease/exonuclease/phosphatase family protein [Anaerolineales bacterium]|nr:endonuclease/exonuclease/phosphatase family protein [Anaerolineales bacterium]
MDSNYQRLIVEDVIRLRRRINESQLPAKTLNHNLLIGTWNIRNFGRLRTEWNESPDSSQRNLRALVYISEIIRCFDVVAIQEVRRDTSGIRMLLEKHLGPNWGMIISDVSAGPKGNAERLAFLYDKRRAQPSGLTGEIVIPPTSDGSPAQQFDRTPYLVGFRTGTEHFTLLTAHIKYGETPETRLPELSALAEYIASEIRERARTVGEETNLIVLGDFNIDDRGENPLFQAFIKTGLVVPSELLNHKTTYGAKAKFYDQIAWFMGEMNLTASGRAGTIDFTSAVFKDKNPSEMSYQMSDHFPLWAEFFTDRSSEQMARILGIDPNAPFPFSNIPD